MAKINYALGVRKEIDEAIDYYEAVRKGLGRDFLVKVESAVERLARNPLGYPCLRKTVRRCLVNRFPYGVLFSYSERTGNISIVAVMHTSRKPGYWQSRVEGKPGHP